MIEAMAQSRRNFCRRNCVHATERGGCTVGARPERVGPQFPRRGGAYYVGIAADEAARLEKEVKPYKRHPLAKWCMTEADCLAYCHGKGFAWMEGDISLYDVLDRVSCWCCRNKNLKELRAIHDYLPGYWERLVAMEQVLGPMKKGKTLPEIGETC